MKFQEVKEKKCRKKKKNTKKKTSNANTSLDSDNMIPNDNLMISSPKGDKHKNCEVNVNDNIIKEPTLKNFEVNQNQQTIIPNNNVMYYPINPLLMQPTSFNNQMIHYPILNYGYIPYNMYNLNNQMCNMSINNPQMNNLLINSNPFRINNNNVNGEKFSDLSISQSSLENEKFINKGEDDSLELIILEDLNDILEFKDEKKFFEIHEKIRSYIKSEEDIEKLHKIYDDLSVEDQKYFDLITSQQIIDNLKDDLIAQYFVKSLNKLFNIEKEKEKENGNKESTYCKKYFLAICKNFDLFLKSKQMCSFIETIINICKLEFTQLLFPYILDNFQLLIKSKSKSRILQSIIDVTSKNEYTSFSNNKEKKTENIDFLDVLDKVSLKENVEDFRKKLLEKISQNISSLTKKKTTSKIIVFLLNSWSTFYCNDLVAELMKNVEDLIYNENSYSILEHIFQNFSNNADLTNNVKKMLHSIKDFSKVYRDNYSFEKFKYLTSFLNYYDIKAYCTHLYRLKKDNQEDSFIRDTYYYMCQLQQS